MTFWYLQAIGRLRKRRTPAPGLDCMDAGCNYLRMRESITGERRFCKLNHGFLPIAPKNRIKWLVGARLKHLRMTKRLMGDLSVIRKAVLGEVD